MFTKHWYPCGLFLCVAFSLVGQTQPGTLSSAFAPEPARSPVIRADVELVLVPVTVTNRSGATVPNLPVSAFTVTEDKTPRPIVSFGSEDVPVSVGVIVDLSGSMSSRMEMASSALRAFFATLESEDEAFLYSVSSRPEELSDFTPDFGSLQTRLIAAKSGGATALVDTIHQALLRMHSAGNSRKALLVISDGMDNHSRHTRSELIHFAEETDVQIYTIGITTPATGKAVELSEAQHGLSFLDSLAGKTGGLSPTLASYQDPGRLASRIGRAMRTQYLIGYRPGADFAPGKWRRIRVQVSLPQTSVSSRSGYYSR